MSRKRQRSTDPKSEFVFLGTALPPLDPDARDDGSFQPLWKQEVRDERGRKRLHGAFTGGWSAGYFNTVGSKEGWIPATFKSSREKRAQFHQATAEDFMDEEDLQDLADNKEVATKEGFEGIGSTEEDVLRRGLDDLVTKDESIGIKLLRKMGWREGQGVGPRTEIETDDPNAIGYKFAPNNTILVLLKNKRDSYGLGWIPHSGLEKLHREVEDKEDKNTRGGIGVGILDDDGEDEDDPYELGPKISYDRILGEKKKSGKKAKLKAASRHAFLPRSRASTVRKCHDGRLPLEGFVLSLAPLMLSSKWFEPPAIPSDFIPTASGDGSASIQLPVKDLNPASRGALLGETPLPGKSVFDFLTPAARSVLVQATGREDLPAALGEVHESTHIPILDRENAISALRGYMPYADDAKKQARYKFFLEVQAGFREEFDRPKTQTRDHWIKELREFAGAAKIFKPMSQMMASRFTTSSSTVQSSVVEDTGQGGISAPKELSQAEQAASISMFGPLTRTIADWYPTRLLCKRFNVRDPHPEGSKVPVEDDEKDVLRKSVVQDMMRERTGEANYVIPDAKKLETERNDALEADRPDMGVFESIFGGND
ncbi:G patch domain-containing protein 1 isoform C [Neolecta irregularis DAH-3]|uniref:G patch domain-containing protein 1 isoform A n=1 Tax=Neolecta irregularis (strain DAH-3) TaxID=1198029 RepID=A0A1U7LM24_NEOID|nr:G patch domain-containing protein 1 isoform A [Neolecta irregularis DAH-3]OLL23704.1 G patch domain-containing protein 1 isoform B [Neolecta irregularis DAH-3]OLL23705.1 G patch domain-containing protein 1 isoform C [Neolecta irregularis DAH-3]|eukprot:OLL23703.1 G patch domain-containing protein 1 isoform A [Neolecta irregularis DAH-3]